MLFRNKINNERWIIIQQIKIVIHHLPVIHCKQKIAWWGWSGNCKYDSDLRVDVWNNYLRHKLLKKSAWTFVQ